MEVENVDDLSNLGTTPKITTKETKQIELEDFGLYACLPITSTPRVVKLYKKVLLPSAKKWFTMRNDQRILPEGKDPKYRSRLCVA